MVSSGLLSCVLVSCEHLFHILIVFFFFQAEDGIRYLVRSRGLGDVYKRQVEECVFSDAVGASVPCPEVTIDYAGEGDDQSLHSVSYTHLTLPTSDLG